MNIFIINGYGVPKNIEEDVNYRTYLNICFNSMYETAANQEVMIIPSGGPTSCTPPYEGTEAEAMAEYLEKLMHRDAVAEQTKNWKIIPETKALSTPENMLNAKNIMEEQGVEGNITFFCEKTRGHRVNVVAKKLFSDAVRVIAVDFDISKNRYLDPAVLKKKEEAGLVEALWALERPENLAKHHELFERKLEYLRDLQSQGLSHEDAVKKWFELNLLHELPADHPLRKES